MKANVFLKASFILLFTLVAQFVHAETEDSVPRINAPVEQEEPALTPVEHPLFAKDSFAGLVAGYHIKDNTPEQQKILGQTIFQADSRPALIFVGLQIQYQQVYLTTQLYLRPFTLDNVRFSFVAMGNVNFYELTGMDTCQLAGLSLEIRPNETLFFQTSCLFLLNFQTLGEIIDKDDYLHPEHCISARLAMTVNIPMTSLTLSASTYETFLYRAYENQSYTAEIKFTPVEHFQTTPSATIRMHDLFILKPAYDETEVSLAIKYLF